MKLRRGVALLWASPITLVGLIFAAIIRATDGQIETHGIAWEASNGAAFRLLWCFNPFASIEAITLGHIIIARDPAVAQRIRLHEQEHVRQYERWGIIFPFAYLAASMLAIFNGGDAYWDNVFEREARRAEGA